MAGTFDVYAWFRPAARAAQPPGEATNWPALLAAVAWVWIWAEHTGRDVDEYTRWFALLWQKDHQGSIKWDSELVQWAEGPLQNKLDSIEEHRAVAFTAWQKYFARYFNPTPPMIAPAVEPQPPLPTPQPEPRPPQPQPAPQPEPQPSIGAEIARGVAISAAVIAGDIASRNRMTFLISQNQPQGTQERTVADLRTTLASVAGNEQMRAIWGESQKQSATNIAIVGGVLNDTNLGYNLLSELRYELEGMKDRAKRRDTFWRHFTKYITAQGYEYQYLEEYFHEYPLAGQLDTEGTRTNAISVPYLAQRIVEESNQGRNQLADLLTQAGIKPDVQFVLTAASYPIPANEILWDAFEKNRRTFWFLGKMLEPTISSVWLSEEGIEAKEFLDKEFIDGADALFNKLLPQLMQDLNNLLEWWEENTAVMWAVGGLAVAAIGLFAFKQITE